MADNHAKPERGYARIDLTGESAPLWAQLRPKFIAALTRLLDDITDGQGPKWFETQALDFRNALLDYAKSRLGKPGAEVERILAEAEKAYSERERNLAEARKAHAEARAQEIKNVCEELRMAMSLTKAVLVGEEGEEALMLGKRIDLLLGSTKGESYGATGTEETRGRNASSTSAPGP